MKINHQFTITLPLIITLLNCCWRAHAGQQLILLTSNEIFKDNFTTSITIPIHILSNYSYLVLEVKVIDQLEQQFMPMLATSFNTPISTYLQQSQLPLDAAILDQMLQDNQGQLFIDKVGLLTHSALHFIQISGTDVKPGTWHIGFFNLNKNSIFLKELQIKVFLSDEHNCPLSCGMHQSKNKQDIIIQNQCRDGGVCLCQQTFGRFCQFEVPVLPMGRQVALESNGLEWKSFQLGITDLQASYRIILNDNTQQQKLEQLYSLLLVTMIFNQRFEINEPYLDSADIILQVEDKPKSNDGSSESIVSHFIDINSEDLNLYYQQCLQDNKNILNCKVLLNFYFKRPGKYSLTILIYQIEVEYVNYNRDTKYIIIITLSLIVLLVVIWCIVIITQLCKKRRQSIVAATTTSALIHASNIRNNLIKAEAGMTKQEIDLLMPEQSYHDLIQAYSELEQIKECVICLIEFNSQDQCRKSLCFHVFHSECLQQWFSKHKTCPYCRQVNTQHTFDQQQDGQKIKNPYILNLLQSRVSSAKKLKNDGEDIDVDVNSGCGGGLSRCRVGCEDDTFSAQNIIEIKSEAEHIMPSEDHSADELQRYANKGFIQPQFQLLTEQHNQQQQHTQSTARRSITEFRKQSIDNLLNLASGLQSKQYNSSQKKFQKYRNLTEFFDYNN